MRGLEDWIDKELNIKFKQQIHNQDMKFVTELKEKSDDTPKSAAPGWNTGPKNLPPLWSAG